MNDWFGKVAKDTGGRAREIVSGRPMGTLKDMWDDWKYKRALGRGPSEERKAAPAGEEAMFKEWTRLDESEKKLFGHRYEDWKAFNAKVARGESL